MYMTTGITKIEDKDMRLYPLYMYHSKANDKSFTYYKPASLRSASALSVRSHGRSTSVRPK